MPIPCSKKLTISHCLPKALMEFSRSSKGMSSASLRSLISQHILLALHTPSNQIMLSSLDKSIAFLPVCLYSHNPFTWDTHHTNLYLLKFPHFLPDLTLKTFLFLNCLSLKPVLSLSSGFSQLSILTS